METSSPFHELRQSLSKSPPAWLNGQDKPSVRVLQITDQIGSGEQENGFVGPFVGARIVAAKVAKAI